MSIHAYISVVFYRFNKLFFLFRFEISPIPQKRFPFKHRDAVVPLIAFLERDLADTDEFREFLRGKEDVGNILSGLAVHRIMAMCVAVAAGTTADDVR